MKLTLNDRWFYIRENIEVVKEYKYLGVIFTSKLSWESHFIKNVRLAKLAINSVWSKVIGISQFLLYKKGVALFFC